MTSRKMTQLIGLKRPAHLQTRGFKETHRLSRLKPLANERAGKGIDEPL